MDVLSKILTHILTENKRTKKWRSFSTFLVCVVVFVTTYWLILPAITIDYQTAEEMSGFDVLIDDTQDISQSQACSQDTGSGDNESDLLINDEDVWIDDAGAGNAVGEDNPVGMESDISEDYLLNDSSDLYGENTDVCSSVLIDDLVIQDEYNVADSIDISAEESDTAVDTADDADNLDSSEASDDSDVSDTSESLAGSNTIL